MRPFFTVFLVASAAATGYAQVRDRAAQPAVAPASEVATLASGWNALASGQRDAAAKAAAQILRRTPWNHAAVGLQIEALSQPDPLKGLDAYERWLGKRAREDAGLLEPVPRAIVLQMAGGAEPDLRHEAVRLLIAGGLPLPAAATRDVVDQLADAAARAKDGDPAALRRLQTAVDAGTVDANVLVAALESAGSQTTPLLMTMLNKSAGPARGAAAAALGRRKADEAKPALLALMKDGDPFVRSSAAVALARMGDDQGQAFVDQMLRSEVPDLRLMAAEAWNGQTGPWVSAIMPLLENRDGTTRLEAARLVAPVNPEAARRTLQDAAGDANPVIRAEAARIVEQIASRVPDVADVGQLRRLLRESDPAVRLHAAGALLATARAGG
jgi:HEAT repeat protein